jgi:hypothetical protein
MTLESSGGTALKEFIAGLEKRADRFALAADSQGKMHVIARSFEGETAQEMAARFWTRSTERADLAETALRFSVLAQDADRRVLDSSTFSIGDDDGEEEMGAPVAEPQGSVAGMTKQQLNAIGKRDSLSLKLLGVSHRQAGSMIDRQAKRIDKLEGQIDGFRRREEEAADIREKLKSRAHKRALRQLDARENSHFKGLFMEQAVNAVPVILDALRGGNDLKRLLESMTMEQFGEISSVLDEKQNGLLAKMLESGAAADKGRAGLGAAPKVKLTEAKEPEAETPAPKTPQPNGAGDARL